MEKKRNGNREGRMEEMGSDRNCRRDCLSPPVFIFLSICLISFLSEFPLLPGSPRLAPENTVLFPLFQTPLEGGLQMSRRLVGLLSKRVGRIFQYLWPSPTAAKEEGRRRSFGLRNFHRSRIVGLPTPNLKDLQFSRPLTWAWVQTAQL